MGWGSHTLSLPRVSWPREEEEERKRTGEESACVGGRRVGGKEAVLVVYRSVVALVRRRSNFRHIVVCRPRPLLLRGSRAARRQT